MSLRFRPLVRDDFGLLSGWLAEPHVQQWWQEPHEAVAVEVRYGPSVDRVDPTEVFVVEHDGDPIGIIQRYRLRDNPEWQRALAVVAPPADAVGIDYLIGRLSLIGRGIGLSMIELFVADTWRRYADASVIVVDVDQQNQRSWRALEKCGFRRTWAGTLDSDDPADAGPCYVYVLERSPGAVSPTQRGGDLHW